MSEHPEFPEIERRLRALGAEPIDPLLATHHLTALAAAAPAGSVRRAPRLHRAKVAAAFAAGLMLGGTSLASAGVLGETPQDVVADVAQNVGLNLPGGTPRSTEGCEGKEYKNHGQFVRDGGDPRSPCGKPLQAGTEGEELESEETPGETKAPKANEGKVERDENGKPLGTPSKGEGKPEGTPGEGGENDGCGPPAWSHGNKSARTPEAVAAFADQCSDGAAGGPNPETTTTVETTTTTAPESTTTTAAESTTTTAAETTTTTSGE
jgi:hypothetical protein